jgi:hypothetical protein
MEYRLVWIMEGDIVQAYAPIERRKDESKPFAIMEFQIFMVVLLKLEAFVFDFVLVCVYINICVCACVYFCFVVGGGR